MSTSVIIRKGNTVISFNEDEKSRVDYAFVPGGLRVTHTEKKTKRYLFPVDEVDSILIKERGAKRGLF